MKRARATLHDLKAQVLLRQGDYFAASQSATSAGSLGPRWRAARLTLARAQVNFGELDMARQTLEEALDPGVCGGSECVAELHAELADLTLLHRRALASGYRRGERVRFGDRPP